MTGVRSSWLILALAIVFVAAAASPSSAQVPPRFYWKSLTGGNAIPVIGTFLNGNSNPIDPASTVVPDAEFSAQLVQFGYARTFALFERSAMAALLVPVGHVDGDVDIFGRTFDDSAGGFGDPLIELTINVIGPKAIRNIPDLERYEPGFSLDLLFDIAFPIGEYDKGQPINIGQNRWYGRVGAPVVWQLGPWVPGRRTTLEVLPSLWLYGDNNDFVGHELSTGPMFQLDTHLTRDLFKDLWASVDLTWVIGGKASLDGIEGEMLNSVALGFTLGYHLTDNLQITGAYMATLNDSEPSDLKLDGFRISLIFGWHSLMEGMKRLDGDS